MSTIYLVGASFTLISLAIFFRRTIYILTIKLMYGEYHIRYMDLINSNTYFQSAYYVKGELSNQVSNIKSALKTPNKKETDQPLYFQNIKYGINAKELVSLLGKPESSDLIDMGDIKVVSMEYNIQPNNVIDKYIYYFYNDEYYLGEFIFNKVANETSKEILSNINTKFRTQFIDKDQFVITDKNNNYLNYKDFGYRISVSYFNANNRGVIHLMNHQKKQRASSKSYYDYQLNIQELCF